MSAIEVTNLCKSYNEYKVLDNVSFEVKTGEVIAVIGASGCGKSTLLRCLINLERANNGSIKINGKSLLKNGVYSSDKEIKNICLEMGMVFQSFNLFPNMSVIKNLILAPTTVLKEPKESAVSRAREMLRAVGLADKTDTMPANLSGGQRQRVAIARALMLNPSILLFDEPTSSLDPLLTLEVLAVLKDLAAQKRTMLVVTHELGFARECATRVFCMDKGNIAIDCLPEQLDDIKDLDTIYRPIDR